MFETISSIVKYIFVLIVYLFIFGIMRLVYLDIKSMRTRRAVAGGTYPYLKLLNQREQLNFKIDEVYTLNRNLSVGRSGDNDIVLADPYLSKKHVMFNVEGGKVLLQDMNSRNGTYLNEVRMEKNKSTVLKDGDKIRMGSVEFLYITPPDDLER